MGAGSTEHSTENISETVAHVAQISNRIARPVTLDFIRRQLANRTHTVQTIGRAAFITLQ